MKKILVNIFLAGVTLAYAAVASAASHDMKAAAPDGMRATPTATATTDKKATYKAAKDSADASYKEARAKCDAMKDNSKDICVAEAKAAEKRSKAEAEAVYKDTPKARMKARIAAADADYAVAKEKCDDQTGNAKDVCVKEAKAAQKKAVVDAKSNKEIGDVKTEAKEDKSEADYKVAIEKCDSLAGPAKDACVTEAKSKFNK